MRDIYPFMNGKMTIDDKVIYMPSGSFYFTTGTINHPDIEIGSVEIKPIKIEKDKECKYCGNTYDLRYIDKMKQKDGFVKCVGCNNIL